MNFSIPPVTWALLIANLLIFLLQQFAGQALYINFALWPLHTDPEFGVSFMPWQLLTYSFLHAGLGHVFFNMFALFMFGSELEHYLGQRRYLIYYLVAVLAAGLMQLLVTLAPGGTPYPTVGASGGVFGLLLAYGMFFPRRMIMLIFPPIPMPAWLFVTLYGVLELYLGVTGTQAGVAHFAHLGGMLGGFIMIKYWQGRYPNRRR